jgi:hypothetical protein
MLAQLEHSRKKFTLVVSTVSYCVFTAYLGAIVRSPVIVALYKVDCMVQYSETAQVTFFPI